jgi:peptidylprolyl isomerase/FKBP-type peptidyl-prolyl cis-trans isomerase FkpA
MKKILLFVILPLVILSGCAKSFDNPSTYDVVKQAAADDATIKAYLAVHTEISPVKDTLGVYYQTLTEGTGAYPGINSTIKVSYTGKLLDGTQFDANAAFTAVLANLIDGWKIVLPHVKTGSKILMIVPSVYGYRNAANGIIPANSTLIFTVELLSTTTP